MKSNIKIFLASVNTLYLIFSNVDGCFEEINGNKYSTLVPINESKERV